MFKPVDSKVSFPQMEERILQFWREQEIFRKSVEQREGGPQFIMYEGPPTANGAPGIHHVLARVFKDIIPRYKTMQGFQAPRKGGWDTHGLPVELEIERELGLSTKRDIEEYGIERFNQRCRESVFRYVKEWETMTDRIGFWIDMGQAYATLTNDYIETGWWIIKQLWDSGLVYLGYKTTPHCPRCGTSLSSHEVALGYDEHTVDPSIYVKFRLAGPQPRPSTLRQSSGQAGSGRAVDVLFEEDVPSYVLAWTTTPWTLPGNTALAVAPEANYAVVERAVADHPGPDTRRQARPGRERLVLAQALVEQTLQGDEYWVVATLPGSELVGLRYQPLYSPPEMGFTMMRFGGSPSARDELAPYQHPDGQPLSYRVIGGDFVSMEDGTGVVHIAPAFGEDDFEIGKAEGLFFVQHVDLKGEVQPCPAPFSGKFVKEADPLVIQELQGRGLMYRTGVITHTYPFCWRCDTPLLYYVKPSWYIRTTALKQELIDGNAQIHWYPAHIREGRFGDWLENNVDWAVSRERYWGTPLPIWQCEGCGHHQCIGSRAELMRQPGVRGYSDDLDLHRPFVDEVTFLCRHCEGAMRRVPEVLDAWFDSGAMPYAQWHYPFEQLDTFRRWYPADFICEAVDQTRGWFYTLHALATLLHGAEPELVTEGICYRHVICLGHILDARGEKMSKSRGNVVDPWSVLNLHGADALRWYLYTASPAGNPRRFSTELVGENLRRFLLTLWNTYSFFVIYANIDQYDPKAPKGTPQLSELDRWIRSELNQLIEDVTTALEAYNPTDAGRRIQDFVEDLSNWYVRRSRRRFWKSGLLSGAAGQADADKLAAYETLYTCLVTLAKLLAPFTPFVAEELYQNLVRSVDQAAPESVHLCRYPDADVTAIDAELSQDTRLVMRVASLGRAARSRAGLKVRQPVQKVLVKSRYAGEEQALRRLAEQVREELNVKDVEVLATPREVSRPRVTFNAKSYGQAFGRELPSLLTEVERLDPEELELALQTSESVSVGRWQVPKAALAVEYAPREGYTVASEGGYLVALSTQVTPELAAEGLARELVHRLQTMRRSAAFEIADNIETYYEGDAAIAQVMEAHQEYIRMETLSRVLQAGTAEGAYSEEQTVEGHRVRLSVRKA